MQNAGISIVIPVYKIRQTLQQSEVLAEQDEIFREAETEG
jgi:hypothetical protein